MFYREDRLQRSIMHDVCHQLPVQHTLGMISTMGLNKSMCDLNKYMIIRFTEFMCTYAMPVYSEVVVNR